MADVGSAKNDIIVGINIIPYEKYKISLSVIFMKWFNGINNDTNSYRNTYSAHKMIFVL